MHRNKLGCFDSGVLISDLEIFMVGEYKHFRIIFIYFKMIKSHEKTIKPITAAFGFLEWLCLIKVVF